MNKINQYLKDSYNELMTKVSWPTWAELQESALVVTVFIVVFSLMIVVMDQTSNGFMKVYYSLFN
jgi:preprotein translocase subunit SecE